jgi:hypothetical protein
VKAHGWQELQPMHLPGIPDAVRSFSKGDCRVLLGNEDRQRNGVKRLHLSISCHARYPHWDEIKDARYALLPLGVTFAMLLPPPGEYVNVHKNCFHLWELPKECA